MEFLIGRRIRKQFGGDISIIYLIKDGIIQACPESGHEMCSNICPFFTYDNTIKKLRLSCRAKTVDIKIEGEHTVNEC